MHTVGSLLMVFKSWDWLHHASTFGNRFWLIFSWMFGITIFYPFLANDMHHFSHMSPNDISCPQSFLHRSSQTWCSHLHTSLWLWCSKDHIPNMMSCHSFDLCKCLCGNFGYMFLFCFNRIVFCRKRECHKVYCFPLNSCSCNPFQGTVGFSLTFLVWKPMFICLNMFCHLRFMAQGHSDAEHWL